MELINAFGINGKILLAQLINFAVLFFILYRFAFKPMMSFLDDRRKKIENGIKNAEAAKQKLTDIEAKEKKVIIEAKKEALNVIEKAKNDAEEKKKNMIAKAKEEIGVIIDQEKAKMQIEKAETLRAIRKEVSGLVVLALEKVLNEKVDTKKDQQLIKGVVKSLK